MFKDRLTFRIEGGHRDDISLRGRRTRKHTVLITIKNRSFPKQALLLGLLLGVCQLLDGILTYAGLKAMGVQMEGNAFLRNLMLFYGQVPVLVVAKVAALFMAGALTIFSARRKWIRSFVGVLILTYLLLAIIPWTYVHSARLGQNENTFGHPEG